MVIWRKNVPDRANRECKRPRAAGVLLFLRSREEADARGTEWARTEWKNEVTGDLGACSAELQGLP